MNEIDSLAPIEFWVTNISKMNVSLGDLRLTVPARGSMNLLDAKHFHYTLEQLQASATNGSLFIKKDKIKVRTVAPPPKPKAGIYCISSDSRIAKLRSLVEITEKRYEELEISDEKYAEEFSAIEEIAPRTKV